MFEIIIFDRDSKFMSNFWQIFFIKLNTKLFISMTYHSQIDNLSKRINQIVEIVIKYFVIEFSNIEYILIFSTI